jgi:hypothetical protein
MAPLQRSWDMKRSESQPGITTPIPSDSRPAPVSISTLLDVVNHYRISVQGLSDGHGTLLVEPRMGEPNEGAARPVGLGLEIEVEEEVVSDEIGADWRQGQHLPSLLNGRNRSEWDHRYLLGQRARLSQAPIRVMIDNHGNQADVRAEVYGRQAW